MPGNGAAPTVAQAYANCRFYVQIDGIGQAVFTELSGLQFELDVVTVYEGGVPVDKHPGGLRASGNVVLKRGITKSNELFKWFRDFAIRGDFKYKNVSIVTYDSDGTELIRVNLINAFPCKWTGAQMTADGSMAAVETLEIAYIDWTVE